MISKINRFNYNVHIVNLLQLNLKLNAVLSMQHSIEHCSDLIMFSWRSQKYKETAIKQRKKKEKDNKSK